MRKNAFCVHGHFYQPPRSNPFTGTIPREPDAAPFDNWNERIFSQCYQPNAELGNFSRISFNIGPTLANWMETTHPDTMADIVRQERSVYEKYGVGNGMAQSFNHTILPLATHDDKLTQVRWGIADFEYRFQHKPQGLWLPETAVDMETLEVLADEGIEFTILAPWQAKCRTELDVSRPYRVELPNNKQIAVFFYQADLSMKVSFMAEATVNADGFLYNELAPLYPDNSRKPRLNIIASDGELYGHHQPFRDKFLEWLTTGALDNSNLEMSFPAKWLQDFPLEKSIKIHNNTSWSCHHGVKRWACECPCAEHGEYKAGLRRSFNLIARIVDEEMSQTLKAYGWELVPFRNEYISVLHRQESVSDQITRLIGKGISETEKNKLTLMMQAQYERQRMFASCGWFFGEFDRLEAQNNIAYASRAIDLINRASGKNFNPQVMRSLSKVQSYTSGLKASTVFSNMLKQGENTPAHF